MGWGNCGHDSAGRPIGYMHAGTCDHPDCEAEIDRGLAYACGGVHGTETLPVMGDVQSCEGYFCEKHKTVIEVEGEAIQMCLKCTERYPGDEPENEATPPPLTGQE